MSKDKSIMPAGYKPVADRTKFIGRLNKLSPAQQEIQRLMVRDDTIKNKRDADQKAQPPYQKLRTLSDLISNNIQAQTDLRSVTPYIKRAEQIWKTLLLKPNGLDQEVLTYDTVDSEIKNDALHSILLQRIKVYFSTSYPIEEILSEIVSDVMFKTGSYVIMDLSHAALDHMINGMDVAGNENFKSDLLELERVIKQRHYSARTGKVKNTGWIRKEKIEMSSGFESIFAPRDPGEEYNLVDKELKWTFTDNSVVLKMGELRNKVVESNLLKRSGMESIDDIVRTTFTKKKDKHVSNKNNVGIVDQGTYYEALKRIYPDRDWKQNENLFVRKNIYYTGRRRGNGITYHIPSEACIPVHINGEKTKPIGFILLTDLETGEFLKSTGDMKFYSSYKNRAERNRTENKANSMNSIIAGIKNISQGKDCEIDMDWAVDMVSGMLEKEIIESFLNGDRNAAVSVTLTEENKKIFLSRAFKQQGVRSVFVPAEAITYFALDYNDFGVGKSLVEEAKPLITRLALLEMANTVASLENAIPKALLTIDLEEENFNPTELIEMVRENYLAQNPSMLNFVGFTTLPIDKQIDGIKSVLVRIKINANDNRNIINPNIEESQDERNGLKTVDPEIIDSAKDGISSHFGLKRSWLEDSEQGNDFAIEALADQELLMNMCVEYSSIFSKFISEHCAKHISFNEDLLIDLINIIKDNKTLYMKPDMGKDSASMSKKETFDLEKADESSIITAVLRDFINNLDIRFPIPSSMEQYSKITDKIKAVDELVLAWKEMGVAENLLRRTLTDMGLEQSEAAGDENSGTNAQYVTALIEGVLRRHAFKKLGVSDPFDEIVADGREGGLVSFVNEAAQQRENVVSFIDELFKKLMKGNKRLAKIGEKYKNGINPNIAVADQAEYNDDENYNEENPEGTEDNEFSDIENVEEETEETEEETEETEEEVETTEEEVEESDGTGEEEVK